MQQARQLPQLALRVTLTLTTLARHCLHVTAPPSRRRLGASFRVSAARTLHVHLDIKQLQILNHHTVLERYVI
jgi:hypothetical protein